MKKLPHNVQSLLSASNQINSRGKAVEELVYNALDADATSIAIRINIQENTIQVIDNGCGISSKDYKSIGHKYMTSKFINISTLKSAPNKYGFRGQTLANLINVSKSVKIVSRHETSDETWSKLFEFGKEKQINKCHTRPSKGTTVEITGFLYNLSIQKKSKGILSDLQSIKTFLEHLSLIHCSISLSLRDDTKNEIIFKIHKNRNITQTLSTLYNIKKKDLQELQVEKNDYKVTAFIGKSENEAGKHFIFLNGKFLSNSSKLHKIVNDNLNNRFKSNSIQKSKMKKKNTEEEIQVPKNIPDYFIFIKCPYIDYDLINSDKHSVLEFKDWNQVHKLLDKLIKFFSGDMNIKTANKLDQVKTTHKPVNNETKEQVKKIIERILGSHAKKPEISNIHNGIKGKQIKRKSKKIAEKSISNKSIRNDNDEFKKIINKDVESSHAKKTEISNIHNGIEGKQIKRKSKKIAEISISNKNISNDNDEFKKNINKDVESRQYGNNSNNSKNPSKFNQIEEAKQSVIKKYSKANGTKSCLGTKAGRKYNKQSQKVSKNYRYKPKITTKVPEQKINLKKQMEKRKKSAFKQDLILRKFKTKTDSVKHRCDKLEEKTNRMLNQIHKETFNMLNKENILVNNIAKSHINVTVRKQIDEIIIHSDTSKRPENKALKINKYNVYKKSNQKPIQSNYDLLQTILNSQQTSNGSKQNIAGVTNISVISPKVVKIPCCRTNKPITVGQQSNNTEPTITYQSHNYYTHKSINTENSSSFDSHVRIQNHNIVNLHNRRRTFIGKQSKDNFVIPNDGVKTKCFKNKHVKTALSKQFHSRIKDLLKQTSNLFDLKKQLMGNTNTCQSSYTIEFSESNRQKMSNDRDVLMSNRISINTGTYVVPKTNNNGYTINDDDNWAFHGTYIIQNTEEAISVSESQHEVNNYDDDNQNERNYIFVSKSQENFQNKQIMDPINVCETILNDEDTMRKEFEVSFNSRCNSAAKNHINETNRQDKYNDSLYGNIYAEENEKALVSLDNQHCVAKSFDDQNIITEVSHHFSHVRNVSIRNKITNEKTSKSPILTSGLNKNIEKQIVIGKDPSENAEGFNLGDFDLKNRLCFVPKGMSPIFQNCQTKNVCEYKLSRDYYEKELYNNFAEDVRNNAEIFEPNIEDAKQVTTKAIEKLNAKLTKDNSELKFDGKSLKNVTVLGQVDEKFIAATMKDGCSDNATTEFLVLLDQHAVHERIRLENNLNDYLNENQWKKVPLDAVSLKISNDDVLYLHNFKDKFEQLGLQWTVTNSNEVSISAVPEAILGKNPRQVEKVIKAVRNLITEEINIIKMQGGCLSLYPKSIMDLVFSEACRYAIKFGDKLSKSECVELLKSLSECKMPFQCAHGRPVMAVITEIKLNKVDYKVTRNKIMEWKRNFIKYLKKSNA